MMKSLCDLHTHSVYSDGTLSPSEIIDKSIDMGLGAVALCDHNTIDGLREFVSYARGKDIVAVSGAEFSVDYEEKELHLLGLFIPETGFGKISRLMDDVIQRKTQSNYNLVLALNNAGYKIDYQKITDSTPNGKFNRAHIAAELTEMGYTQNRKQAFETLLSEKNGYYRPPKRPDFRYMLDFLNSVGAVTVLAHPLLNLDEERLDLLLAQASENGLQGMECYYSTYDETKTQNSLILAEKYHLCPAGGSDFHGDNKPDIALGRGKGSLEVPFFLVNGLQQCAKRL